jgi:hypothetical protein
MERVQVVDGWATWKRISKIFININFDSWLEKISRMIARTRSCLEIIPVPALRKHWNDTVYMEVSSIAISRISFYG